MTNRKAIRYAIYAALLYAISTPFSKVLLKEIPPVFMAGLLYLGAAIGMCLLKCFPKGRKKKGSPSPIRIIRTSSGWSCSIYLPLYFS